MQIHAKRVTILDKDIKLALRIRGDSYLLSVRQPTPATERVIDAANAQQQAQQAEEPSAKGKANAKAKAKANGVKKIPR
jgi:hypothetical protein